MKKINIIFILFLIIGILVTPISYAVSGLNTDFTNAKIKTGDIELTVDENEKLYATMKLEIYNITRNLSNDKNEYSWYVSLNQNETNIKNTDWVKVTEEQPYSNKLVFTVNSKSVKNASKFLSADVAYIYIKEVATKDLNESIVISKPIVINRSDMEGNESVATTSTNNDANRTLLTSSSPAQSLTASNASNSNEQASTTNDGSSENEYEELTVKGNQASGNKKETKEVSKEQKVETTAKGSLPYTGSTIGVMAGVIITAVIGIIGYRKYKNLSQYV